MNRKLVLEEATGLLLHEAHCLDTRMWDEWLDLFTEDAIFWVPAWRDEEHQTDDPDREVSMMYYDQRARLAERVWRARSGQSLASTPLPRTVHSITNIVVADFSENIASVSANWNVHVYDVRRGSHHVFFGFYAYNLQCYSKTWKIRQKKISVLNDRVPVVLDFYNI